MSEFYFAVIILGNVQNMNPVQNNLYIFQLYTYILQSVIWFEEWKPLNRYYGKQ